MLRGLNINVVFTYNNTIKNSLIKNSPYHEGGSVYFIPCKGCDLIYIGQTGKSLEERIKQHKYSVRSAQESSGVFKHVERFNHSIDWGKSKSIYWSNCMTERLLAEGTIIRKTNSMNLNEGLYKIKLTFY